MENRDVENMVTGVVGGGGGKKNNVNLWLFVK